MSAEHLALEALAWLLTYAVHSSVLLLLAWAIATYGLRRESSRERVWKLALVGGIATASVQCLASFEPHGGTIGLTPGQVELAEAEWGAAKRTPSIERESTTDLFGSALDPAHSVTNLAARAATLEEPLPSPPATPTGLGFWRSAANTQVDWRKGLFALWLAGGSALACLFAVAAARLRDHLAGRTRLRAGPQVMLLRELCRQAGLRRPVRLMLSPKLKAPVALGTLFPEICVPPRALLELESEEQRALLAHELAHIVRFDPTWLSVCRWMETLLFFQPLNRLARRRLDHAAELLCDEQALRWTQNRLALARCLAAVAEWLLGEKRRLPACGMAGRRSRLSERVERILEAPLEPARSSPWIAPAGGLALGATVLFAPVFAQQRSQRERTNEGPNHEATSLVGVASTTPAEDTTLPAQLADLLATVQAELTREFSQLQTELASLRLEVESQEAVPAALQSRVSSIETRLGALRIKKNHLDELVRRWLASNPVNTTIDVMDRSH